jgi:hypothetical protein
MLMVGLPTSEGALGNTDPRALHEPSHTNLHETVVVRVASCRFVDLFAFANQKGCAKLNETFPSAFLNNRKSVDVGAFGQILGKANCSL